MFGHGKKKDEGPRGEALPPRNTGLPDSTTLSGLCPRCGNQSSFDAVGSAPVSFDSSVYIGGSENTRGYVDQVSILECRHCEQRVVVVEEKWVGDVRAREGGDSGSIAFRGFHWWPLPEANPSADIPAHIASAFSEAVVALAANCPRASAVMARRTLEAVTVDRGQANGRLVDRLQALAANGDLTSTLADWATEVRLVGNTGAHFDPIDTVSKEDAEQLVSFVRELLNYLYVMPAELARRRSP